MTTLRRLDRLADDLAQGRTSARALTEACLAAIEKSDGEGARCFITVTGEAALAQAQAIDSLRAAGMAPSPWAGIPISIKDLFDLEGEVTTAGSKVLADTPPAKRDAPAIARLRRAGLIFLGRTNMTEFAFSGLGVNPHHGTPGNPQDRETIPGGSSSGAAVSVADGMACGAIGTDTGGSCRIPAAFCGITGFKPTQARVPLAGSVPLSYSLDSVGPLAPSVSCCAILDSLLAGAAHAAVLPRPLTRLRLGLITNYVLEDLDETVANRFSSAVDSLSSAGAIIEEITLPTLERLSEINAKGGMAAAEAWHWHRTLLEAGEALYDPRVSGRIRRGANQSARDYLDVLAARRTAIEEVTAAIQGFDALIYPTTPIVAPRFSELEADSDYLEINNLVLRNSALVNFLDGTALSLPLAGEGPSVGMTVMGLASSDAKIFSAAAALEARVGRWSETF